MFPIREIAVISPTMRSLLETSHLGTLLSVHKPLLQRMYVVIFVSLSLLCLGLSFLFRSDSGNVLLLLLAAVVCLVQVYLHIKRWNDLLLLCQNGLLYLEGKQQSVVYWDEIETVVLERKRICVLNRRNHTSVRFPVGIMVWTQGKLMMNTLEHEVVQRLLPTILAQFEQGHTVFFGEVAVSRQGISGWFETIAWDALTAIEYKQSKGAILKAGQQTLLTLAPTTPNLFVCVALIQHILDARHTS